jgi:hypothetical protein
LKAPGYTIFKPLVFSISALKTSPTATWPHGSDENSAVNLTEDFPNMSPSSLAAFKGLPLPLAFRRCDYCV